MRTRLELGFLMLLTVGEEFVGSRWMTKLLQIYKGFYSSVNTDNGTRRLSATNKNQAYYHILTRLWSQVQHMKVTKLECLPLDTSGQNVVDPKKIFKPNGLRSVTFKLNLILNWGQLYKGLPTFFKLPVL